VSHQRVAHNRVQESFGNRVRSEAGNDLIAERSGLFARIGNDPREEEEGSSLHRAQIVAVEWRWIARADRDSS